MRIKWKTFSFATLILAGFASAFILLTPGEIDAVGFCEEGKLEHWTDQGWAQGSNCTTAMNALFFQLLPQAVATCGGEEVCNAVLDAICHLEGGQIVADGRLRYSCPGSGSPMP